MLSQNICYVPFKMSMIGDPVYDLGDVLTISDGIADGDKLYCITKYTFRYNGAYEVQGVGKNPSLSNAKSKTDKNIAGLINQADSDVIRFTVFSNTGQIKVGDKSNQSIFDMRFITTKTTHIVMSMEILLTVETTETGDDFNWVESDAVAKIHYYIDGEELTHRTPVETWQDGQHILTLRYDLQEIDASIHTWDVWIEMDGGSITIEPYGIHAVALGQGMAAESQWDGTISASEDVTKLDFSGIFKTVQDNALATNNTPAKSTVNELIAGLNFLNMFRGISDGYSATENVMTFTPYVNSSLIITDASYNNTTGWQGSGNIKAGTNKTVTTCDICNVTLIEVSSQNAVYQVSFDSGVTWQGWTSDGWIDDVTMIKKEIDSVPESAWKQHDQVRIKALLEAGANLYTIYAYGGTVND